jgi:hypothetical protein
MSGIAPNPLNDISKVYLEAVAAKPDFLDLDKDGNKKEPMKKAAKEVEAPKERLKTDRNMFNISKDEQKAAKERLLAKARAKRASMGEGLDPVGQEDADIDNDGDTDKSDKYLHKRRKAISKAMKRRMKEEKELSEITKMGIHAPHEVPSGNLKGMVKKAVKRIDADNDGDVDKDDPKEKGMGEFVPSPDGKKKIRTKMSESRSNWRHDLSEVMVDDVDSKQIKEKNVKNKIKINPKLGEAIELLGGTLIEMVELEEETPAEKIDRISKENVAKRAALAKKEKEKRAKSTADFQAHKKEVLAKGGRPVDALDSWQKKKMNKEEVDINDIIESVYDELIEEGYSQDEVEYGIDVALNTLEEGYYDSAVAASKAKSQVSLKDRVKSAAKKAIVGGARAVGKAVKAGAAVAAAPERAKTKVKSLADRVKRAARSGYAAGRGPVEKKTTYRGSGVGRKEKIGEEVSIDENVATGKAKRARFGGIAQKVGKSEVVTNKEKSAALEKHAAAKQAKQKAAGEAAHKAASAKGLSPAEAEMRRKAAERKAARMRKEEVEQLDEMPYQVMGSPDGKKEKKIGKPVKSKKYADSRAAELADTHKKTGGKYRSQYVEDVEQVDEKLNLKKADMGDVIKDFYKSDAPQFKGRSKEKRREMAIAAKLTAERGGRKLGESSTEVAMSPQELALQKRKTMIDKMITMKRQQALQKSGKTKVNEEESDRARDERQMRGGMDGNIRYDRPPAKKLSNKELGIKPGKTAVQKAMEKKGKSALDIVKADVRAKYGKGSVK